jgi:hypothetical protein
MPIAAEASTNSKADAQESVLVTIAKNDFRLAEAEYGEIRVPSLPKRFKLVRVSWTGDSVDLRWHRASDDAYVHLWQTKDGSRLGTKDPSDASTGSRVTIDGSQWVHNTVNACSKVSCLSRRFDAGEVVSLDGTLGLQRLQRIAASI